MKFFAFSLLCAIGTFLALRIATQPETVFDRPDLVVPAHLAKNVSVGPWTVQAVYPDAHCDVVLDHLDQRFTICYDTPESCQHFNAVVKEVAPGVYRANVGSDYFEIEAATGKATYVWQGKRMTLCAPAVKPDTAIFEPLQTSYTKR